MNFLRNTIHIDKRKGIVGIALAVVTMLVCAIFGAWARFCAYGVMLTAAGFVSINTDKKSIRWIFFAVWLMMIASVTWAVPANMVNAFGRMQFTYTGYIMNILCIFAVCGIVFMITANLRASVVTGTFLLVLLSTVNGIIYQFRGKEMGFGDILSIKTAISVAGKYNFKLQPQMVYGWLYWIFFAFAGFSLPKIEFVSKMRARIGAILANAVIAVLLNLGMMRVAIKTWDNEGTRLNGYYLNFYIGMCNSGTKKPAKYSPVTLSKLSQEYTTATDEITEKPNIVVVMDESFADFRIFGDLKTNRPVTPFIDSLIENTVRGYTLTSVYGGNTANAEFEFLTGESMAFLPKDSVPYQQFIKGETYTLARLLSSYGYKSVATHPYWKSGWSRDLIYPYFGFDEMEFLEDYNPQQYVRDYVGDEDVFDSITQKLSTETEPLFVFGITMQNHGGYDYPGEDFEKTITLEGYEGDYPLTEQYLSLINKTDSAFEKFITDIENFGEKTVVLFFGDHFPGVEPQFYEEIYGKKFETLQDKMLRYKVPFLIWTNYETEEKSVDITSMNFLSNHLLKMAGLPLSPYNRFLEAAENNVVAMNAMGYVSKENGGFVAYDKATGSEYEWIEKYRALMYNHIFDRKNKNLTFFGY